MKGTILNFGKHRGKAITEIDEGYLRWMSENMKDHWRDLAKHALQKRAETGYIEPFGKYARKPLTEVPESYNMPFGKYVGKPITEVPESYLLWMAKEMGHRNETAVLARKLLKERNYHFDDFKVESVSVSENLTAKVKACNNVEDAKELIRKVSSCMELASRKRVYLMNVMLLMLGRWGEVNEATKLFNSMEDKNAYSSNTMIKVYLDNKQWDSAHHLFTTMLEPSTLSCTAMISYYSTKGRLADAKAAFDRIQNGQVDKPAWNALLICYSRNGSFDETIDIFEKMRGYRNIISWNAIISCAANSNTNSKLEDNMAELIPMWDAAAATSASLLNAKLGMIDKCQKMFGLMPQRDIATWIAQLCTYARKGQIELAEDHFRKMPAADQMAFNAMLSAYVNSSMSQEARELFDWMPPRDLFSWILVIAAFARNGQMQEAMQLLMKAPTQDVKMYNSIFAGYSLDGEVDKSIELLHEINLEGLVEPDGVSFVGILSGFSHVNRVEDGRKCFLSMKSDYGLEPWVQHYTCMIDMMGRAGYLEDAEELVENMPYHPDLVAWHTLQGACRSHKKLDMAKRAYENSLAMDSRNATSYVLLANLQNDDNVGEIVKLMKNKGAKRVPGVSTMRIGDKVHKFVVGDKSHSKSEEIYKELERLSVLMKDAGYVPDTSVTMLPGGDAKEKEDLLCRHSEKLALAYAMISTEPGKRIQITKNLRMCYDCHHATRFLSKTVGRTIVVKDANRIHRFENGICSCKDHW